MDFIRCRDYLHIHNWHLVPWRGGRVSEETPSFVTLLEDKHKVSIKIDKNMIRMHMGTTEIEWPIIIKIRHGSPVIYIHRDAVQDKAWLGHGTLDTGIYDGFYLDRPVTED
jgi:hypothetical protein